MTAPKLLTGEDRIAALKAAYRAQRLAELRQEAPPAPGTPAALLAAETRLREALLGAAFKAQAAAPVALDQAQAARAAWAAALADARRRGVQASADANVRAAYGRLRALGLS